MPTLPTLPTIKNDREQGRQGRQGRLGKNNHIHIPLLPLLPLPLISLFIVGNVGNVGNSFVDFVDVTRPSGITFKHTDGRSGQKFFMETLGSGAAFFDYDNDGDLDLYFVNGANLPGFKSDMPPTNVLYRNDGDGKFTEVTSQAGVGDMGYGFGCAVGDYDNDGYLDLYVTNFGPNVLYHNNGDGTFSDVTVKTNVGNVDNVGNSTKWSSSCAFADYDNDGGLDLYVTNYIDFKVEDNPWCGLKAKGIRAYCEPNGFNGLPDTLYHNNRDGTFTEVTKAAGIREPAGAGKGLGVVWGDYDNDGYVDIFVANDSTPNFLYHNNKNGTFTEVAFIAGVAVSEDGKAFNGMGASFGDYDNDGYLDLIVTNYADQPNSIYHNDGGGFFSDLSFASGVGTPSLPYLAWGVEFIDYDNDGYQDIFVANGHLHDNLKEIGQRGSYAQHNQLFHNIGEGKFEEVTRKSGTGMLLEKVSRGAAFGDYDNDGDVDILVTNSNQTPDLLRNDGGNSNNWLMIQAVGTKSNRAGIGARIKVVVDGHEQIKEVRSGTGYLSQNDLRVCFGLNHSSKAELVEVKWPGGVVQRLDNVPANQTLVVIE